MSGILVHVAGYPIGDVQKCRRCGVVLADNTNCAVPDGSGPPAFFGVGRQIAQQGYGTWQTDETPNCKPVELRKVNA